MPVVPPNETPRDMRDLLIRLDEKVANGFATITQKLDAIEARANKHDDRLKDIEVELADRADLKARFYEVERKVENHEVQLTTISNTASVAERVALVAKWILGGLFAIGLVLLSTYLANRAAESRAAMLAKTSAAALSAPFPAANEKTLIH